MKVYLAHPTSYDFKKELYLPLRKSHLNLTFDIILPHERVGPALSSKNVIKKSDLLIAEVSIPSTAVGIEIGWANAFDVPIVFIYKMGSKISKSFALISDHLIEYQNSRELVSLLTSFLTGFNKA